MVVEAEVEVEEVAVFVSERRLFRAHFFGGPFPTVPSPLQVCIAFHLFCLVGFNFLFILFGSRRCWGC